MSGKSFGTRGRVLVVSLFVLLCPGLACQTAGGVEGALESEAWKADGGGERGPAVAVLCTDAGGRGYCAKLHAKGGYEDLMDVCVAEAMWTCTEWLARRSSSLVVLPESGPLRVSLHEEKAYKGKTRVVDLEGPGTYDLMRYDFNDRPRSVRITPVVAGP